MIVHYGLMVEGKPDDHLFLDLRQISMVQTDKAAKSLRIVFKNCSEITKLEFSSEELFTKFVASLVKGMTEQ